MEKPRASAQTDAHQHALRSFKKIGIAAVAAAANAIKSGSVKATVSKDTPSVLRKEHFTA